MRKAKGQLDFEKLRSSLKVRHFQSHKKLHSKHKIAHSFWERHKIDPGKIRHHAKNLITSTALATTMMLGTQAGILPTIAQANNHLQSVNQIAPGEIRRVLRERIESVLPMDIGVRLSPTAEKQISEALQSAFGIKAVPELEGHRLNHDYGRMGAEQHLPRFPGDSAEQHENLVEKGITPGKGGWGYFAYSKNDLTPELEQTEKYYVAVQTLYLPDWNTNTKELSNWYKYRRVVVVNPANGKTVIAAVADAGPSVWTGKHFGGSPEVMQYLGIDYGMQNHPVVLFFLDDPDHKIPLGPLEYNVTGSESET